MITFIFVGFVGEWSSCSLFARQRVHAGCPAGFRLSAQVTLGSLKHVKCECRERSGVAARVHARDVLRWSRPRDQRRIPGQFGRVQKCAGHVLYVYKIAVRAGTRGCERSRGVLGSPLSNGIIVISPEP